MQSDRPVRTRIDPRSTEPSPAAHPIQPVTGPEEGHEAAEEHVHLPPQSVWPITLAAGISLAGMGMVTTLPITALGAVLGVIAIINWIQELRHEHH